MNGDAASIYAARRLQLAAAGSSPKALLAAVVTTATMFRQPVCRWRMDRVVGRGWTSVRWRMGSAGWEENGQV